MRTQQLAKLPVPSCLRSAPRHQQHAKEDHTTETHPQSSPHHPTANAICDVITRLMQVHRGYTCPRQENGWPGKTVREASQPGFSIEFSWHNPRLLLCVFGKEIPPRFFVVEEEQRTRPRVVFRGGKHTRILFFFTYLPRYRLNLVGTHPYHGRRRFSSSSYFALSPPAVA